MTTPSWGQQSQPPVPVSRMSAREKGCFGCGGALVLGVAALAVIGAIIGPQKKAPAEAKPPASPSVRVTTSPRPTPASHSASAKPSQQKRNGSTRPKTLAHGAQQGLTNCIIRYTDAQNGPGTSTYSALVLNDSGQPYPPTGSNPYSIIFQLAVTGADGKSYSVTEALGNGARTAADNGGSDWFTVNQGDVGVSANSVQGAVDSTVPVPLARVTSLQGNIVITSQNDDNYLEQKDCAVRLS
ncbi:hypothetical protein [Streptomyces sp. NPDC050485]|uniref:hypothetical protein n=1 Tax=Streptomyces sp. NPDC050485 TaxID=3365617 RepID=UPI00379484ED